MNMQPIWMLRIIKLNRKTANFQQAFHAEMRQNC